MIKLHRPKETAGPSVFDKLKSLFRRKKPSEDASYTVRAASGKQGRLLAFLARIPFRSLRARGLAVSTSLVLVAILLVLGAFAVFQQAYYYSAVRTALVTKADTASAFFSGYVTKSYAEYYNSALNYAENFDAKDSLELQFISADGRVEICSNGISAGSIPGSDDISTALTTGKISSWQGKRSSTGERILAVSAPLLASDGTVVGLMRYVTSLVQVDRVISRSILLSAAIAAAILTLVILSNLTFLRTITEPITSLTAMAKRIAEGSYGTKVEKHYDDEIGELTDTINDMSRKLSQAERLQTEFISSVSHELRTPLTAITGWAETMAYDEAIQGDSRRGVEIITREAARLTKMVEELLEFTRIQDGRFTLHVSSVDVPALVEDSLYTYNELFRHENMTVSYVPPENEIPEIPGDPERLAQVFLNILDNACKYGKSGKKIDVSITEDEQSVTVSIRDYGHGIPAAELSRVKEKFFKGSSKERGSGIGLAVCDEIVTRHNGTLTIENAEGGGVRATVTLPKKA